MRKVKVKRPEFILDHLQGRWIRMLDVGARNDTLELPRLADVTESWGFEPNPEEHRKLLTGMTDRRLKTGVRSPRYRSNTYLPVALADREGDATLYLTRNPGCVSLLKPNPGS